MKRLLGTLSMAVAALALLGQGADAQGRRIDPAVKVAHVAVGTAATLTYLKLNNWHWGYAGRSTHGFTATGAYVATTAGCIVVSPMVATMLARRHLTYREAHMLAWGCVVPIVGPMLVNAAYDANPHWEPSPPPPPRRKRR